MRDRNKKLLQVLNAKYQDAQAQFHAIDGRLNEIRALAETLRARRRDMAGLMNAVAEKHILWIEQEMTKLSSEEANLMVRRIELQRTLQKAFGQREAFKAVMKKRDQKAALEKSRQNF